MNPGFIAILALTCAIVVAQEPSRTQGGTRRNPPASEAPREPQGGEAGSNPQFGSAPPPGSYPQQGVSLTAELLDPAKNFREHKAEVKVIVSGIRLVDPAEARHQAKPGEGHLTYRLDWGPVIETTATKLGFSEIPAGLHHLDIEVAANDGTPLGPHKILTFSIPSA